MKWVKNAAATKKNRIAAQTLSTEKPVEFLVRADPKPGHRVTFAISYRSQIQRDADRPDILFSGQLFEP
ncbi:MAG: hypothetical protein JNG86_19500 [Verrucomicrobiaceae bacterium]|nr:hypothetical protein [Verrucomicrobiaceae bacterium]